MVLQVQDVFTYFRSPEHVAAEPAYEGPVQVQAFRRGSIMHSSVRMRDDSLQCPVRVQSG